MPTATRRYQLHLLMNENRAKQEHYDNQKQQTSGKNTITGDSLKAKMKSGEINI